VVDPRVELQERLLVRRSLRRGRLAGFPEPVAEGLGRRGELPLQRRLDQLVDRLRPLPGDGGDLRPDLGVAPPVGVGPEGDEPG
jgi:hypothetical protein